MSLTDYLTLENPEVLAIGVALILFTLCSTAFQRVMGRRQKGIAIIISLVVSAIASWKLYSENFYGWESTLVVILIIAVAAIFLRILWAFIRHSKAQFGA
jgi:hypothetical protein